MTRALLMAVCLLALSVHGEAQAAMGKVPPMLPRQFQAEVVVTSHLTEPDQVYPPSVRRLLVQYDYDQQIAKAEVLQGHDQNKVFVRRYDTAECMSQKREYMVKRGKYRKCQRAYLGDDMPIPEIPFQQQFVGVERVRDRPCEHWVHSYSNVRVHVYSDMDTSVPIRLTEENLVDGVPMLLLTFDLCDMELGPQNVSHFAIPDGYEHDDCERIVTGFPYIHAFHYYLRF